MSYLRDLNLQILFTFKIPHKNANCGLIFLFRIIMRVYNERM